MKKIPEPNKAKKYHKLYLKGENKKTCKLPKTVT